jgi:1,4-alpha-glucan branching enzyme
VVATSNLGATILAHSTEGSVMSVFVRFVAFAIVLLGIAPANAADAWLDGDKNAIWGRSPGFYKEKDHWYAIIHVKPNVTRVRLAGDFTAWDEEAIELTRTPDGKFWWFKGKDASFKEAPAAGDRYKFILNVGSGPDRWHQDPAARRVENSGSGSNSLVTVSSEFNWTDSTWKRREWYEHSIYQVHPLRFTSRNKKDNKPLAPLLQVAEELDKDGSNDYINKVGATAVQLLPVNEFATDTSWGYNPAFFYAIESAYGKPDDLKKLVDTAHRNGIAVFLDVVFNHAGSDNILWEIAQEDMHKGTYFDGDTEWGALVNFNNDVARHFFAQNIAFLAREYHIDGFRFDFTRIIHDANSPHLKERGDGGGWHFLREVRSKAKAVDPGIVLIAEELPNNWYVSQEDVDGDFNGDRHGPFDSQWVDDFHDKFKAVLTGGHLDELKRTFTYFGDNWQDGLIYTESHDEVGNTDDRIAKRGREGRGYEMSQIAAAGTILGRGIPMIFMGQEAGETMQFGQDNEKLRDYNPGTGSDWWDDRLDLKHYESDNGRTKLRDWYRRMFEIRKSDQKGFAQSAIDVTHIHNDDGIAAFTRGQGKYLIVMNFKGDSWPAYRVGVEGRYKELGNTSWPAFNVGGYRERTRHGDATHDIGDVPIPAYGVVVLRRE